MNFDGDWLRPILAGAAGAVVVAILLLVGRKSAPDEAGWRRIVPGYTHWTAMVLGIVLVPFFTYVRLAIGSARADAASQMIALTLVIAFFVFATIGNALTMAVIHRRAIRWRGSQVVWLSGGHKIETDLNELNTINRNVLGQVVLRFVDGTVLKVDPYSRGAQQLLKAARERLAGQPEDYEP